MGDGPSPFAALSPHPADRSAGDLVLNGTATPTPSLRVTITDTPDPVLPGGTLRYVVTVINVWTLTFSNVWLVDTLPGVVLFQTTSNDGSRDGPEIT